MIDSTAHQFSEQARLTLPPQPPRPPEPLWDNFPIELTIRPQWVNWRRALKRDWPKSKKPWTKEPYQPNGTLAACDNPSTWSSFEAVQCAYYSQDSDFDGVGFVLSPDDPFVGFDFDAVLRDGKLTDSCVLRWLRLLDSYTEVSPSGSGLRVVAAGKLPFRSDQPDKQDQRIKNYEVYDRLRYLTLTGDIFEGWR